MKDQHRISVHRDLQDVVVKQIVTIASFVVVAGLFTAAWALALQTIDGVGAEDFADPGAQLRGILADPLGYLGVLVTTAILQFIPFVFPDPDLPE